MPRGKKTLSQVSICHGHNEIHFLQITFNERDLHTVNKIALLSAPTTWTFEHERQNAFVLKQQERLQLV